MEYGVELEQETYFVTASARLIRQQILGLIKNIPVVELEKIDTKEPMITQGILERYLTESQLAEYRVWAWLLMKLREYDD